MELLFFFLKQLLSENDQCRGYLKGGNSNIVFEVTEKKYIVSTVCSLWRCHIHGCSVGMDQTLETPLRCIQKQC